MPVALVKKRKTPEWGWGRRKSGKKATRLHNAACSVRGRVGDVTFKLKKKKGTGSGRS